ncbi:unnamed protein product [Schistosoma mattheei]|uniref:Uncharacterized protein n=1 Tax=Schistosoma mattheei TaxID=31246 RepID=A0AA85BZ88_9TREM|nr:unnamed protein product [Schistosoma mattheei]
MFTSNETYHCDLKNFRQQNYDLKSAKFTFSEMLVCFFLVNIFWTNNYVRCYHRSNVIFPYEINGATLSYKTWKKIAVNIPFN